MKFLAICVLILLRIVVGNCNVIPNYLPQPCVRSNPKYNECTTKVMNLWLSHLSQGIPDIETPKLYPLHIPAFVANRSLSNYGDISLVLKDARVWGFNSTFIESFRYNRQDKSYRLHLRIPYLKIASQYAIASQISFFFYFSGENSGFCRGNATDIHLYFKFTLWPVERQGAIYYTFHDFDRRVKINGGKVEMVSKNPKYQFVGNIISSFINNSFESALSLVNIVFKENMLAFYKTLGERILMSVPANELIPE